MPNRMLRDWTNSDKVNSLSVQSEVFFTRLIMKADDYGCFWADPKRLKANLFPLKDSIRETDIPRWLAECQMAGLIVVYESDQKKLLQIIDFKQRLDRARSKFPQPSANEIPVVVNDFPPEREGEIEVEVEEKVKSPAEKTFSSKNKTEENSPGPEILYTIEHCITVAMADDRWARKNKASPEILTVFNSELESQGIYQKNPDDYKRHFFHWSKKQNGTHQPTLTKSSVRKSAGAEALLASLKNDIASRNGSGP